VSNFDAFVAATRSTLPLPKSFMESPKWREHIREPLKTLSLCCNTEAQSRKVLEVGTGSGYQAVILSVLAREVYTIEIVPELGEMARTNLERLGYSNVSTKIGDGYQGWAEHAPFDAIIVTAAPSHVPPPLIAQLKSGGPHGHPGRRIQSGAYGIGKTRGRNGHNQNHSAGSVRAFDPGVANPPRPRLMAA
jgi:protein-L-isoaspartate(D-aspartate) O-methyltransferase